MRKPLLVLLIATLGCASNDEVGYPGGRRAPDYPRAERSRPAAAGASGVLELMPPDDWWRDPQIQIAVNVSADQMKALDDIGTKQQAEVVKMRQDSRDVIRDLRSVIESEHPQSADVIAAGERVRKVRDALFDRELGLLDAERQVLTRTQWTALQTALQERPAERRDDRYRGGYGRHGRGRFPG